jgi:linoleoyl-CoA desaturase
MTLYWCTLKDFINAYQFYKEKTKGFKNIGFHFCMIFLLKIVYFLFWIGLPLIFWKVSFISTLLFFIIMHFVAGLFLSLVFQLAHVTSFTEFPKPIVFDTREEHQIRTTCNFAEDNKFITWITGGLNHQIEHHLFPHISHVHYPKIAPIVKEYCKEKKHPYNSAGNFIRAVISHFEYLSKLGRINDPS